MDSWNSFIKYLQSFTCGISSSSTSSIARNYQPQYRPNMTRKEHVEALRKHCHMLLQREKEKRKKRRRIWNIYF